MPPDPRPLATDDVPAASGRAAGGRARRPDPFSEFLDAESRDAESREAESQDAETRDAEIGHAAEADGGAGAATGITVPAREASRRAEVASEPPAAASPSPRRGATPLRARQVQRILRYIAPWSALKVSFFFYLCLWLIVMVAGVILWIGASSTGVIDNVESFVEELFGLERFAFEGGQMFRGILFGGFALVLVGTAFNVLIAVLFNLISDLTGGLRLTVVEVERAPVEPARHAAD